MRTTKELLILLRDYIKDRDIIASGLCQEIYEMFLDNEILSDEVRKLNNFIYKNRPRKGKHFDIEYQNQVWYWKKMEVAPRLAWLNDLIDEFEFDED